MRSDRLLAAAIAAGVALAADPGNALARTVLGFQGFEGNGQARVVEENPFGTPGILTEEQQVFELVDTGEGLASTGAPILEFVEPDQFFDPANPDVPLPGGATGRFFDASNSSLPWTLKWANDRVTDALIEEATMGAELAEELRLQLLLGFPVDLTYLPTVTAAEITGPVVPDEYNLDQGIFSVTQNVFLPLPAINGVGGDSNDSVGVNDSVLLGEFDGSAADVPEGDLAFFAIDADGLYMLEFDAIDATGFAGLRLSFKLAAGGNSNTFYGDFDRFSVEVNGVEVESIEGRSNLGTEPDPITGEVDELDVFSDGSFQQFDLDLSDFDGESSVQVTFLFGNNNDGGNNFDAFALDDITLTGVEPTAGDFNGDGAVDAADYTEWRDTLGQSVPPGTGADADGDGVISLDDYDAWESTFGATSSLAVAVPEPTCLGLAAAVVLIRPRPARPPTITKTSSEGLRASRAVTTKTVAVALTGWLFFCVASSRVEGQTLLGFQGFETNSPSAIPDDADAVLPEQPGVLTLGQQELELSDSGRDLPNGNSLFEFVQPTEFFNFLDPDTPLAAEPTGRVFDATDGSLPWRLLWGNSRLPPNIIADAVAAQELADEIRLSTILGFPVDLTYIPLPEVQLPGPVIPDESIVAVAFNPDNNSFVPVPAIFSIAGQIGDDADQSDAFGVVNIDRFSTEFGLFAEDLAIPEGSQAFYAADSDGSLLLEFDPVDASGFGGLQLTYDLAIGDTGYEPGDRFAIIVNGETVLNLEEFFDEVSEETVSPLQDHPNEFTAASVDLSRFAGESSVQISFLMDSTAGTESFGLDNVRILGFPGTAFTGDYNGDGLVDAGDYTIWRDTEGQNVEPGTAADGDGDGVIGSGDFVVWRANFGNTTSGGSANGAIIPEPSSAFITITLVGCVRLGRRRCVSRRTFCREEAYRLRSSS